MALTSSGFLQILLTHGFLFLLGPPYLKIEINKKIKYRTIYFWRLLQRSKSAQTKKKSVKLRWKALKGTVAWDGLFAKSNPSDLVMEDLKYFWPGSTKYRVTSQITSFSVLAEYAKHVFSLLAEYAKWRKFLRYTKYFASYFNFANMYLIPNL